MPIHPPVLTETQRRGAFGPPCAKANPRVVAGSVTIDGRTYRCHEAVVPVFRMWEQVRASYNYRLSGDDTGCYNCRPIAGTSVMSAHAFGTAFDIDWLNNPDGKRLVKPSYPMKMIEELQFVRTNSGAWVIRWGGDWDRKPDTPHSYYDPMHWEVVAHPDDLATGIVGLRLEDDMSQSLSKNLTRRTNAVEKLQRRLNKWQADNEAAGRTRLFTLTEDGIYGTKTEEAVRLYQQAAGLEVTGVADATTITFIFDTGED